MISGGVQLPKPLMGPAYAMAKKMGLSPPSPQSLKPTPPQFAGQSCKEEIKLLQSNQIPPQITAAAKKAWGKGSSSGKSSSGSGKGSSSGKSSKGSGGSKGSKGGSSGGAGGGAGGSMGGGAGGSIGGGAGGSTGGGASGGASAGAGALASRALGFDWYDLFARHAPEETDNTLGELEARDAEFDDDFSFLFEREAADSGQESSQQMMTGPGGQIISHSSHHDVSKSGMTHNPPSGPYGGWPGSKGSPSPGKSQMFGPGQQNGFPILPRDAFYYEDEFDLYARDAEFDPYEFEW